MSRVRPALGLMVYLCVCGSALAQQPRTLPDSRLEAAFYIIPPATTYGVGLLLLDAFNEPGGAAVETGLLLSLPLLAAGVTCATGHLTGVAGSCGAAAIGGVAGALPGLAIIGSGYLAERTGTDPLPAFLIVSAGLVAYVVLPPIAAIVEYRRGAPIEAGPVYLAAPEAEALGLRVRLGL